MSTTWVRNLSSSSIIRRFWLLAALFLVMGKAYATHYRAGELMFRFIAGKTYEVKLVTYTDPTNTNADRNEAVIDFGDGTNQTVNRVSKTILNSADFYPLQQNTYTTTHTYNGPGMYIISFFDQNRVDKIININNGQSVNIPFYVEAQLLVSDILTNQSPVLNMPPLDGGCLGVPFLHNPVANDPDGDSLYFSIIPPQMDKATVVTKYSTPKHTVLFRIDSVTGQLTWDSPMEAGIYNIAIKISEFRKGVLIGYVVRDMQILISFCNNKPPVISELRDTCVRVGQKLEVLVTAKDSSVNIVSLYRYGGPFSQVLQPAITTPDVGKGNPAGVLFSWTPSCRAARKRPHMAVFRAVDNSGIPLSDIKYFYINVLAPPLKLASVVQDSNGLSLRWNKDSCNNSIAYKVYRRVDSSYWSPDYCQAGVPEISGFRLVKIIKGRSDTFYFDNDNGRGLSPLVRYCYRVTAVYPTVDDYGINVTFSDSVESIASNELCMIITRSKPVISNVSVRYTHPADGSVFVKWLRPSDLDTTRFLPPYKIMLKRAPYVSSAYQQLGVPYVYNTFSQITDSFYIDSGINTSTLQYKYKLEFYSTSAGFDKYVDESVLASSVFLKPYNTNRKIILNYSFDVPWSNYSFVIYRKNKITNSFDSIATTNLTFYTDTGLFNGDTNWYYVKTIGRYNTLLYSGILENNSQEIYGIPRDTIPPCPPPLLYQSPCSQFSDYTIKLNWTYPAFCDKDVVSYTIYYRKNAKEVWDTLGSVNSGIFSFTDSREQLKRGIAGCYAVTAIDSNGNESSKTNAFCIDNCPYYVLPNVFTPGSDGHNDLFKPFPYRFVDKIDLHIFNRWGQQVYQTVNPDINWSGKDQDSGADLTGGVYYYICTVFENYLDRVEKRTYRGTITLLR